MALPKSIRRLAPDRVRDHPGLRAVALAAGLIPPRTMHTAAEAAQLRRWAASARSAVEIGVSEGSSTAVLCAVLTPGARLYLIDPFTDESGWAMRPGWHGTAHATRLAVALVEEGQALVLVLAGMRYDQPQVGVDQALLRIEVAARGRLRELPLLLGCQQRIAPDLAEEEL